MVVDCSKGLTGRQSRDTEDDSPLCRSFKVVFPEAARPFEVIAAKVTLRCDLPLGPSNPTVNNLRDQLQASVEHRVRVKYILL